MDNKVKIVSTIGPATATREKIEALMDAGVDVFRQNFSHGSHEEKKMQQDWIRELAAEKGKVMGKDIFILQDLQGPKIRLGDVKSKYKVQVGDVITLDYALREKEHDGTPNIPLQYNLANKVKIGSVVYLNDGKVGTKVIEIPSETAIKLEVTRAGWFSKKKGINMLGVDFGNDIFPAKDLEDMKYGGDKEYEWLAVSFIQSAENLVEARKLMKQYGYSENTKLVAKVETYEATKSNEIIDAICKEADVIMVARGDMGYEIGAEAVPTIQRKLIAAARKYGKEVIVATQVMSSMEFAAFPTRAEADNVAEAVISGATHVMTSEETAMGEFPVETVKAMEDIIGYTEKNTEVMPLEWLQKIAKID